MTTIGKIANYDAATETGFILPEAGGERLSFKRADLPAGEHVPQDNDRYEYETAGEGNSTSAVKMRKV